MYRFREHKVQILKFYLKLILGLSCHIEATVLFCFFHEIFFFFLQPIHFKRIFFKMDYVGATYFLHGLLAHSGIIVQEYDGCLSPYQTDELNWTEVSVAK